MDLPFFINYDITIIKVLPFFWRNYGEIIKYVVKKIKQGKLFLKKVIFI